MLPIRHRQMFEQLVRAGAFALAATAFLPLAGCDRPVTVDDLSSPRTVTAEDDANASLLRLGDFTLRNGDLASAVALYRRAHAADPAAVEPLLRLGSAYATSNSPSEAAGAYQAVLDREPANDEALRGLANALLRQRRPAEALLLLEGVLARDQDQDHARDYRLYNSYGVTLDQLGRHGDAQAAYERGLALSPGDPDLRSNLAISLSLGGRHDEAVAMMRSVATSPQADVRHRQNLALVLGLAGRDAEAAVVNRLDLDQDGVRREGERYARLRAIGDSAERAIAIGGMAAG